MEVSINLSQKFRWFDRLVLFSIVVNSILLVFFNYEDRDSNT